MITRGYAGVDCTDCGYSEIVNTSRLCEQLEKMLEYSNGDPLCPSCGTLLTFEDYIKDDIPKNK